MTIDLMALAQKADKTYIDVEVSYGKLRVYHVPDAMLLSVGLDYPEPEMPIIRMKTATGFQNRDAKPGDVEYEAWRQAKTAYENDGFELRVAIGTIKALKDIDWATYDLTQPPPIKAAQEMYKGCWPDHDLLRKKAWLDWTVLFIRNDRDIILTATGEMRGEAEPTDDMVDEVKKNSD